MSTLARGTTQNFDAISAQKIPHFAGNIYAGEALDANSPCCMHSDGLVYMSNGTAADANAQVDGFVTRNVAINEPVTLYAPGLRMSYGTLTPGASYYVSATKGRLDTAPTTGGLLAVARAINTTDLYFTRFI